MCVASVVSRRAFDSVRQEADRPVCGGQKLSCGSVLETSRGQEWCVLQPRLFGVVCCLHSLPPRLFRAVHAGLTCSIVMLALCLRVWQGYRDLPVLSEQNPQCNPSDLIDAL